MNVPLSLERLMPFEWRVRQVSLILGNRVDLAKEVRFFCRCMAEDERKDISVSISWVCLSSVVPSGRYEKYTARAAA